MIVLPKEFVTLRYGELTGKNYIQQRRIAGNVIQQFLS
jgi:hypothetical protein